VTQDQTHEPRSRWELLTQTGAGTPMGDLLRRYWWPIAGASELDRPGTKPLRLLGEDLVLYKDLGGRWGLLDRHCRHRRADLSYGYVEACGLRCNYHGWLYDEAGRCLAQPYEDVAHPDARLKDEIHIKAYPVAELGGLLWAYLGPEPRPLVPEWEFFSWPNGFRQIVKAEIPCNWFQCQENSIDPVHFEWTHSNWSLRLKGMTGPYAPHHVRVDFSEFEYGFQYKRIRTDTSEHDELWTIGRVACGRMPSSPAITSNTACLSTTKTRSASTGPSAACQKSASPMSRRGSRPGKGRSPTRTPGAGSPATS